LGDVGSHQKSAPLTAMGAHVHDSFCCLLTIVLFEMKAKFFDSQSLLWSCLNEQMMRVMLPKHDFHGFMVNATSVNDNAIHNTYDGDPNVPLEGKECTCFYHLDRTYGSIEII
jgi:hypothetical protein